MPPPSPPSFMTTTAYIHTYIVETMQGLRERIHSGSVVDSSPTLLISLSHDSKDDSDLYDVDLGKGKYHPHSPKRARSFGEGVFGAGKASPRSTSTIRSFSLWWSLVSREMRIRWSLLSVYSRAVLLVVLPLLAMHVIVGTCDIFFHHYGPLAAHSRAMSTRSSIRHSQWMAQAQAEESFAVVINSYKRPDMLRDAIRHYAGTCGRRSRVEQVFVVWAEVDAVPPEPSSFFSNPLELSKRRRVRAAERNRATVQMIRVEKDSLNSRFLPIDNLRSSAVFMVDDDVRVDCHSLYQGFMAWKNRPDSMVGFYPRLVSPSKKDATSYVYHSWFTVFWRNQANLVLTKASFLHQRYLDLYSDQRQHPQEVLDYVDNHFNCEDVAMSMLVANVTAAERRGTPAPPIYVEGTISDKGIFNGISTGKGTSSSSSNPLAGLAGMLSPNKGADHFDQRSRCMNDLAQIYQKHGRSIPLGDESSVVNLREASWLVHAPGFWFQYRPSNVFEWWPQNVFK